MYRTLILLDNVTVAEKSDPIQTLWTRAFVFTWRTIPKDISKETRAMQAYAFLLPNEK